MINVVLKRKNLKISDETIWKKQSLNVPEMWYSQRRGLQKTETNIIKPIPGKFPCRRSLVEYQLLGKRKSKKLFGFVQCSIEVSEHLKPPFAVFRKISKNTSESRKTVGKYLRPRAEEKGSKSQFRTLFFSSLSSHKGNSKIRVLNRFQTGSGFLKKSCPHWVFSD